MSQETAAKKEKEKKKAKNKQDKEQRKKERQANNNKGKSLDDMIAYVDDDGNLSDTPPDPSKKKVIYAENIVIGVAKQEPPKPEDLIRTGTVTFFNDAKGYGFINDLASRESVFVHINQLSEPIKEGDKVTFETEKGQRGINAIKVKRTV